MEFRMKYSSFALIILCVCANSAMAGEISNVRRNAVNAPRQVTNEMRQLTGNNPIVNQGIRSINLNNELNLRNTQRKIKRMTNALSLGNPSTFTEKQNPVIEQMVDHKRNNAKPVVATKQPTKIEITAEEKKRREIAALRAEKRMIQKQIERLDEKTTLIETSLKDRSNQEKEIISTREKALAAQLKKGELLKKSASLSRPTTGQFTSEQNSLIKMMDERKTRRINENKELALLRHEAVAVRAIAYAEEKEHQEKSKLIAQKKITQERKVLLNNRLAIIQASLDEHNSQKENSIMTKKP